tara:strand:+ start:5213 stop:6523 length:1311 start_codon:yes stop_codon:yes gene_type:complete
MTISSTTRVAGPFTGNGVTTIFPFTFKVFSTADVQVVRLTISTSTETTLTIVTDYNITLNGDQDSNPGGNIVLVTPLLALYTLTATSDIANLQPTDLTNQGGFYPEVITDSFDRATIQIQQMSDNLTRSLKAPVSDDLTTIDMTIPVVADRINKLLAFDGTGVPTTVAQSPSSISGNTTIVGTLGVTGATTLQTTLGVTGNTTVGGTLGVTGQITGNVTGNVTGNTSGSSGSCTGNSLTATTAGTVTTAAQPAITSVGTLTSLAVTGSLTIDSTTMFVDSAANRVGIGTTSPSYTLDVNGSFSSNNILFFCIPTGGETAASTQLAMTEQYDPYNVVSSGIFTAVTAGVYFFSYSVSVIPTILANTFQGSCAFNSNATITAFSACGAGGNTNNLGNLSGSIIVSLGIGDFVSVRTYTTMTNTTVRAGYGSFIGYMLQ